MYRHCIYCSAELGRNEALEGFPVGRSLAFDAGRGRLWAVCGRCARWNLAPIEERWEAVDAAERLFADTRQRVQRENIGLARLRDGTRLIRIGAALPGELAAWRYGGELLRRRRRYLARGQVSGAAAAAAAGGVFLALGPMALVGGTLTGAAAWLAAQGVFTAVENGIDRLMALRADQRPVHRLGALESPTGEPLVLRRAHLRGAFLAAEEGTGELLLRVPALPAEPYPWVDPAPALAPFTVGGDRARSLLARALVGVNASGASPRVVEHALAELSRAGSADAYLSRQALEHATLELPRDAARRAERRDLYWTRRAQMEGVALDDVSAWRERVAAGIAGEAYGGLVRALALEVALHEAGERRALEGELALLESAWREAEELAAIADRLAGETGTRAR